MKPLIPLTGGASVFVPYRVAKDDMEFFLQKRDMNPIHDPGVYSMFGGGIETGETPELTLFREVTEELAYDPQDVRYFSAFARAGKTFHVFIEEVGAGFEDAVTVLEGEHGRFIPLSEIRDMSGISPIARLVMIDLGAYLSSAQQ